MFQEALWRPWIILGSGPNLRFPGLQGFHGSMVLRGNLETFLARLDR